MARWKLHEAKQQFSRLVDRARDEGPQVVTRNGKDVAVVVAAAEYERLRSDHGAFKRFLLQAPDLDLLEIERDRRPARSIDL
ncbi:MAG: type II toxin-antitoxin system prevent-host-death family antitoxin [Gaiellaceae bacterium MAG52_C11]|nr:type II toxin-antitoxin system prevent-host-death family antitoxin [Candidatus Gaiellasilicea maunaloa]